jgi:hypothetical protein
MEGMHRVVNVLRAALGVFLLCSASQVAASDPLTLTTSAAQNITQTTAQLGGMLSRALATGESLSGAWVNITDATGTSTKVSLDTALSGASFSGVVAASLAPGSTYSYTSGVKITYADRSYRMLSGEPLSFATLASPAAPASYPTVQTTLRQHFSQQVPTGTKISCRSDSDCAYWTWTSPDGIDQYQYWVFASTMDDYSMTVAVYANNGTGQQKPIQGWKFWGGRYNQGVAVNQKSQTVEITAQGGATLSVPLSTIQIPNPPQAISVVSAVYGGRKSAPAGSSQVCTSTQTINLTSQVTSACGGQTQCNYEVPFPPSGGDPADGCYKSFSVRYKCRAVAGATEYVEDIGGVSSEAAGQTVSLKCDNLPGITIVSATYGASMTPVHVSKCPTVQTGNRTTQVGTACNGLPSCAFTVSAGTSQGGDPAFGCSKNFVVDYKCSGSDAVQSKSLLAEANGRAISIDCAK